MKKKITVLYLLITLSFVKCVSGEEVKYTEGDVRAAVQALKDAVANKASKEEIAEKKAAFKRISKAFGRQKNAEDVLQKKRESEDAFSRLTPEEKARFEKQQVYIQEREERNRQKKIAKNQERIAKIEEKERIKKEVIRQEQERKEQLLSKERRLEADRIRRAKLPKMDPTKIYYYVKKVDDLYEFSKYLPVKSDDINSFVEMIIATTEDEKIPKVRNITKKLSFQEETQQFITTEVAYEIPFCGIERFQEVRGTSSILEFIDTRELEGVRLQARAFQVTNKWLPKQSKSFEGCDAMLYDRNTCQIVRCTEKKSVSLEIDYGYMFEHFEDARRFYERILELQR